MSINPHISNAHDWMTPLAGFDEVSMFALNNAQIEATLAVAWETGRLADEARTANLIAGLQPVEFLGKKYWRCDEPTVLRIRAEISTRLYPEGATE